MLHEFKFPDVGEGVHEGKILQFKFNPGDPVEAGDILAVIETDKVVAEIPSPKTGILESFGAAVGQVIRVGSTLAVIRTAEAGGRSGPVSPQDSAKPSTRDAAAPPGGPSEEAAAVVGKLEVAGDVVLPSSGEGIADAAPEAATLVASRPHPLATPMARKLASDRGLDISKLKGTGPAGRVMKADILAAAEATKRVQEPPPLPASARSFGDPRSCCPQDRPQVPVTAELSTLRKTVARTMEASHLIPSVAVHDFAIVDDLVRFRAEVNAARDPERRIGLQAFFMKALAVALRRFPAVNSAYDAERMALTTFPEVHVGFAAEGPDGLAVPVVRHCESRTVGEIDGEMKALVVKLRAKRLALDDLRGGTISITNYGAFGGIHGTPMILPPQAAILGFGRLHEAPVVKAGAVVPATVLPVSLVFDHRALDGAPASAFLTGFLALLADPRRMLLEMV